jgi:nicastrin
MNCFLVTDLITPIQQFANHYVGVLIGSPSPTPYVGNIDDTARFIWNFLASRTGILKGGLDESSGREKGSASSPKSEECTTGCTKEDEVCVASTGQRKGYCLQSTTRLVLFKARAQICTNIYILI